MGEPQTPPDSPVAPPGEFASDGRFRVGVTGHRTLSDPACVRRRIQEELSEVRRDHPDAIACTALAPGADTIFAEVALALGLRVEVVVPFPSYPDRLTNAERERYHMLLAQAAVFSLAPSASSTAAYTAAGMWVLARSHLLLAVWDGKKARGAGGTADIVARARKAGLPVHIIHAQRAGSRPSGTGRTGTLRTRRSADVL